MTPARTAARGFTYIELIAAVVIVAILAATAAPILNSNTQKLARASHELVMNLRLARDLAIATRRHTWVDFDVANERYSLYIESPTTPGRANRVWLTDPVTGDSQFTVTLNQGEFIGVAISTAAFGGRAEVEFDRLGKPYDGMGVPLAADGTATIAAGITVKTVRVVAETGLVKED